MSKASAEQRPFLYRVHFFPAHATSVFSFPFLHLVLALFLSGRLVRYALIVRHHESFVGRIIDYITHDFSSIVKSVGRLYGGECITSSNPCGHVAVHRCPSIFFADNRRDAPPSPRGCLAPCISQYSPRHHGPRHCEICVSATTVLYWGGLCWCAALLLPR